PVVVEPARLVRVRAAPQPESPESEVAAVRRAPVRRSTASTKVPAAANASRRRLDGAGGSDDLASWTYSESPIQDLTNSIKPDTTAICPRQRGTPRGLPNYPPRRGLRMPYNAHKRNPRLVRLLRCWYSMVRAGCHWLGATGWVPLAACRQWSDSRVFCGS